MITYGGSPRPWRTLFALAASLLVGMLGGAAIGIGSPAAAGVPEGHGTTFEPVPTGATFDLETITSSVPNSISGRVVDIFGAPIEGAKIVNTTASTASAILEVATTDADGRFFAETHGWEFAALPPDDRPDLAAAGIGGRGLYGEGTVGLHPSEPHHRDVTFVLAPGHFFATGGKRIRPTEAMPVTAAAPPDTPPPDTPPQPRGSSISGINIVAPRPGAAAHEFAVEYLAHPQYAATNQYILLDISDDLVPDAKRPSLVVTCFIDCVRGSRHSVGPWGHQLAVHVGPRSSGTLDLEASPGALWIDPPLIAEVRYNQPHNVYVSDPSGCPTELTGSGDVPLIGPAERAPFPFVVLGSQPPTSNPETRVHTFEIAGRQGELVYITGFAGTTADEVIDYQLDSTFPPCSRPERPLTGYAAVSTYGTVYGFGEITNRGNAQGAASDVRAIELTSSGDGYWIVTGGGVVTALGSAVQYGDLSNAALNPGETVNTMASTPDDGGYWLVTSLGRVVPFGSARWLGDASGFTLDAGIIAATATPSGMGYYLVGGDGGIFTYGDAAFHGSVPGILPGVRLNEPVVGITADPDGTGYWLVASDGGVFTFEAEFRGSLPGILSPGTTLAAPIGGMVPYGNGYLLVAGDGGVFNISNRPFFGSLGDVDLPNPIVAIATTS